jgi:hypothetical protein
MSDSERFRSSLHRLVRWLGWNQHGVEAYLFCPTKDTANSTMPARIKRAANHIKEPVSESMAKPLP